MKHLELVEISRGIAALLVVCFHATGIIAAGKYFGVTPLGGLFNFGYSGVDFFFVLSGFIIYLSTATQHQNISAVGIYLKRRLIRIYPIYWAVALTFLPLLLIFGATSTTQGLGTTEIIKDFFLLPRADKPFITVAWTLRHEMLFYFSFLVYFINARLAAFYFIGWTLLIVFTHALQFQSDSSLLKFYLDLHNIEFVFGIFLAWFVIKHNWSSPKWFLPVGLILFLIGGGNEVVFNEGVSLSFPDYHIIFGISSLLVIGGIATIRTPNNSLIKQSAVFLGKASYSVYLIHYLVLSIAIKALINIGTSPVFSFFSLVLLGIMSGGLLYQYIERPLLRFVRIKTDAISN